jgi:hypothetical protein
MINRFSSRKQKLDKSFLNERLVGAKKYDRIAGYFSSSILEIAGESLESVEGTVRMVCNSQLNERDVMTSRAALAAMRKEWCASEPENYGSKAKGRFAKLHDLFKSGKLEVKVLPDNVFGLIHGKGGVITLQNGGKTSFIGSANETYNAWKLNYEIVWEDDSPEAVQWVQEEFDALWVHPDAQNLADFVIEDIDRIAKREVIQNIEDWRKDPDPASSIVELPVYRNDLGLWEHQKYFIKLAFDAHQGPHGARFVLADMVGLGKTLQLAMVAQLMALTGDKPILILAPKTLIWQWQDEMTERLDLPSAVWNGKQWVDEQGIEYPVMGPEGIKKCPRRIGVVSYGLITKRSTAVDHIKELNYDCIIVDEAHHARRKNLGLNKENESPEPNNLLSFLQYIGGKTKSMLLATATPVQLYPIEAWDILKILASGNNESVLGTKISLWQRYPVHSLNLVTGKEELSDDVMEVWNWIRNPFPSSSEDRNFEIIRSILKVGTDAPTVSGSDWDKLGMPEKERVRKLSRNFMQKHNPFIRHIVRRTRNFLENKINEETHEPYLKPIKVKLYGEDNRDAIILPLYLDDAYKLAEEFCRLFSKRSRGGGFLKTLLLRRVGSTLYAGKRTSEAMLGIKHENLEAEEEDEDENENEDIQVSDTFKEMSVEERNVLERFLDVLSEKQDQDPKYHKIKDLLQNGWLERGCIIFSQYYDSIDWLSGKLSHDFSDEIIGIYAGGQRSGFIENGEFIRTSREKLKSMVRYGEVRLLLGTDAASEGLNLQTLGSLINLDLPWNPTRLEQRKGRIQRIGQVYDDVWIYNMRYKGSVEDRVHELLSSRLEAINNLFGQIPDCLKDVWVDVALGKEDDARKTIGEVPIKHPFEIKYDKIEPVHWEKCSKVLDSAERRRCLMKGW